MSSRRSEQERAAWAAMRELVLERGERRPEVVDALGMSFIRAKVLRLLLSGPLPQRDVGLRLFIDKPYTSVVVGELETRGYVVRSPDPSDRRVRLVSLTTVGRRAATRANDILERPPAWVRELAAADLAVLRRLLDQGLSSEASQRL